MIVQKEDSQTEIEKFVSGGGSEHEELNVKDQKQNEDAQEQENAEEGINLGFKIGYTIKYD